jgi:hypothetical protein
MYIFRPWHGWIPFSILAAGLYVSYNYNNIWEMVVGAMVLYYLTVMVTGFMLINGVIYQLYLAEPGLNNIFGTSTSTHTTKQITKPQEKTADFQSTGNWKGVPALSQMVKTVGFDMERQFAKTLITMRDYKPKDEAVDFRETTWIRPNKFKTRDEYIQVIEKWKYHHVIAKKDPRRNSTYRVVDWTKVEMSAKGNHLPPPPQ